MAQRGIAQLVERRLARQLSAVRTATP
jgi:hypothetical protein